MNKKIKFERHAEICDQIKDVYRSKNEDYGDSIGKLYSKLGDITILTRISDKYERLMGLMQPGKKPNHESIDDTILDMANYCIIWAMERSLTIDPSIMVDDREEYIPPKNFDELIQQSTIHRGKPLKMTDDQIKQREEQMKKHGITVSTI